jgi:hypothetical protein
MAWTDIYNTTKQYSEVEKIKTYQEWIAEDFAEVGTPPAGNVSGMGAVVPPTSTTVGSGDTWDTLGAISTQVPVSSACDACKKNGKKSKCKFCQDKEKSQSKI